MHTIIPSACPYQKYVLSLTTDGPWMWSCDQPCVIQAVRVHDVFPYNRGKPPEEIRKFLDDK